MALFARLLDRQFVGPAPCYAADVTAAIGEDRPDWWSARCSPSGRWSPPRPRACPFDVLRRTCTCCPRPVGRRSASACAPAKGRLGRRRDRLVTAISDAAVEKGLAPLNELRADHGLAPLDWFWDQVHRATVELVLAVAGLRLPGAELRPNVRYVGAVLDDPAWAATADWEPPPGEDPLVLVALSRRSRTTRPASSGSSTPSLDLPVRAVGHHRTGARARRASPPRRT